VVEKNKYVLLAQASLLLSVGIWILVPVIGVIFLLASLQLLSFSQANRERYNFIQNSVFLVACVTLSMFCASIDPFQDTYNYIQEYQSCGRTTFVDCLLNPDTPYEPGLYLLAYPIFKIFDGSNQAFLLIWSFLMNFILFFYVCKPLSDKYAPLLGFTLATNLVFYSHTFYMRQFMSMSCIVAGIACLTDRYKSIFFILLGCIFHYTSIFYIPIIYINFAWLRYFLSQKIWYVIFGSFAAVMIISQFTFSPDTMKSLLIFFLQMNQDSGLLSNKSSYFMDDNVLDQQPLLIPILLNVLIGLAYLYINFNNNDRFHYRSQLGKISRSQQERERELIAATTYSIVLRRPDIFNPNTNIDRIMMYIYTIQLVLAILTINFGFLTVRLCMMTLSFTGIFLFPMLRQAESKTPNKIFLSIFLCFSCAYITYYFYNLTLETATFKFMNGKVLSSSIADYVSYTIQQWNQAY
jgi:hypothetical protein